MMRMSVRPLIATLLLGAAVASAACSGSEAVSTTPPAGGRGGGQGPAVPVTATSAQQKAVPLDVTAIGTVIAASTVAVRAQITGELMTVNFKEGDEVEQGQVLFTLDKRPFEAALAQAEAQLQKDVAQAANAKAQAVRYQDLAQRGIATREQVDSMTSQAAALEGTVAADRANIQSARVQLDYATIEAPISGRTGLLQVHKGNLVRANDTIPIVSINRITPVYVTFAIPESMLPQFKRYMGAGTIRVEAQAPNDTGRASIGRIDFIDIAVDSMPGHGTCVTLRLKGAVIRKVTPPISAAPRLPRRDGAPSGTVLYIEDNAANALIVQELLAQWPGVRLLLAADGQSGIALARQTAPDLVLLDMRLPDLHGIEVLAALRMEPLTASIPVVSLSASAMPEEVDAARAAGATAYWTKPIDFAPFLKGVSSLLAKRATRFPPA